MQAAFGNHQFSAPTMDPFEAFAPDPDAPAPPPARIRPFNPETDLKLTRYLVGAATMEPSSHANQAGLFKPLSLLLWGSAVHLLITRVASGYPAILHNYLYPAAPKAINPNATILQTVIDSLILIPLVLAPAIAILAVLEWRHRNLFEMAMRRAIGEEDMRQLETYYDVKPEAPSAEQEDDDDQKRVTRARAKKQQQEKQSDVLLGSSETSQPEQRKGFWVLEYDNRLIGAVGLDGFKPGRSLDSVVDQIIAAAADKKRSDKGAIDGPSSAAEASSTATVSSTPSTAGLRPRGSNAPSVSVTPPTPLVGAAPASFTLDPSASLPQGTLHVRRFATSMSFRSAGIEDDLLAFVAHHAFADAADLAPETGAQRHLPSPAQQIVIALIPSVQASLRRALIRNGFELVPRGSELDLPQTSASASTSWAAKLWPVSLEQRTMVLRRATWEARKANASE